MIERIKKLADMAIKGEMYVEPVETQYDREDRFLPDVLMNAKRAKEYILNQKPRISEFNALTGYLKFDGDVMGDIFNRVGHENFRKMFDEFYMKPIDGLCTFEWQHSVADFEKVIKIGISGLKEEISRSKKAHSEKEETEFLEALDTIADAIILWADKCSAAVLEKSAGVENPEYKQNLVNLSKALKNVPEKPAETFFEAILAIVVTFSFVPDSIGCIDRYLYPFYKKDIENGTLNVEDAKAYLQELFLMLQAKEKKTSPWFRRGGQSHFCVGGYLENGEDGFNELSKLIIESMLELPTWIPQISLRWTKRTPFEVLKYVMDCERKDPNKRIAFVNDEPRIKALTEIAGFPYEIACKYTMVGCNEPQLPGGIFMGGCDGNVVKAIENTLYKREDIINANDFEAFYAIFEEELNNVLEKVNYYYEKFQEVRSRDVNIVSSMFFEGSIERAKSITGGGAKNAVANLSLIGIATVIDSLSIIKQFVYDEKIITAKELIAALKNNWRGFEDLRTLITKKGKFFGNDDDISNECADRFVKSIASYLDGKKSNFGYNYLVGNLIGYHQHHKWFGNETKATSDGRFSGDPISFGLEQSEGKDREGLAALLSSIAKLSGSNPVLCGDSVTNIMIDEQLVKDDDNFDKFVKMLETYFKMGGLHYQLNYVSKEDLKKAKISPDKYKNLRVRVSGFSDYFVSLNEDLQNSIIERTGQVM